MQVINNLYAMMNRFLNYLISLLLPTMFGFVGCKQATETVPVPIYGVWTPDSVREQMNEVKSKQVAEQQDSLTEIINETTELQ